MGVKVKERFPGSGVFWIFINHNGRRKTKKVGSEEAALRAKAMIEARLVLGNSALPQEAPSAPILEEYCKRWRDTYLETAVKESTRKGYVRTFERWILPILGKVPLNEITREKVEHLPPHWARLDETEKTRRGPNSRPVYQRTAFDYISRRCVVFSIMRSSTASFERTRPGSRRAKTQSPIGSPSPKLHVRESY
jgi:hypothetical protein